MVRRVVLVAHDGFRMLDLAGPADVFDAATRQTGMSPGRYVERSRADAARRLLELTDYPLDRVARETGLGRPETLHRVFRRRPRVSPGDYRRGFHVKEI
jgi:transcriptional regulator GlxA family with amidase domain